MKLSEIMKDNTNISIATVDSAGMPKVRMFNHQFIVDGKICFATSNQGSAYADFATTPYAEIMQFARAMYVRIGGKVVKTEGQERLAMLEKVAAANPQLVTRYTEQGFAEKMEVFYFEGPAVNVVDFKTHSKVEVEIG